MIAFTEFLLPLLFMIRIKDDSGFPMILLSGNSNVLHSGPHYTLYRSGLVKDLVAFLLLANLARYKYIKSLSLVHHDSETTPSRLVILFTVINTAQTSTFCCRRGQFYRNKRLSNLPDGK